MAKTRPILVVSFRARITIPRFFALLPLPVPPATVNEWERWFHAVAAFCFSTHRIGANPARG